MANLESAGLENSSSFMSIFIKGSSGTYPTLSCTGTYKENLNLLSSWIDGAAIYGFDSTRSSLLRTFSGGIISK